MELRGTSCKCPQQVVRYEFDLPFAFGSHPNDEGIAIIDDLLMKAMVTYSVPKSTMHGVVVYRAGRRALVRMEDWTVFAALDAPYGPCS